METPPNQPARQPDTGSKAKASDKPKRHALDDPPNLERSQGHARERLRRRDITTNTADLPQQRIEKLLRRVIDNGDAPTCQEALDRVQLYQLKVRPGKETYFDPRQRTIFIEEGLPPWDSVAAYTFAAMQATY